MCQFEPVNGGSVTSTIDVHDIVIGCVLENLEWPSYGCYKGLRVASWWMNMWEKVGKAVLTYTGQGMVQVGVMHRSLQLGNIVGRVE